MPKWRRQPFRNNNNGNRTFSAKNRKKRLRNGLEIPAVGSGWKPDRMTNKRYDEPNPPRRSWPLSGRIFASVYRREA